ncbi:50S ribosomal protein L9 [Planctomycetes bacterium Poly30]|uniref:Large ribosomal subunit protein bL9 n=1 Tax=Saltatorellus ferox TaxID=2528018 RepID=A0A518ERE8_9BACT|nr:50S ribosomal protein L9 [Planctomycetes bacterium Poly30]
MKDVEVLLQQSVKHLGLVGDVVKVKPGYARNYLFPQKLGVMATEDAKRQIARRAAKVREAEKLRLAEVAALVEKLEEIELNVTMKSDPNGNLYGSVNAARIVELAAEQGATFTEKDVRLDAPIKTVGEHQIKVHVRDDDYGTVQLNVIAEGRTKAEEAALEAAEMAAEAEAEAEGGHDRD